MHGEGRPLRAAKKAVGPSEEKHRCADELKERGLSTTTACKALGMSTSTYYYKPKEKDDGWLSDKLKELAEAHPTEGSQCD